MWIENRKISFAPCQIQQKNQNYILTFGPKKIDLNALQYQYFDAFQHGDTIHSLVQSFLFRGWVVSFRELWLLLNKLNDAQVIMNPEIQSYFAMTKSSMNATGLGDLASYKGQVVASVDNLKSLPFFRTLHPDLQKLFVQNASVKIALEQTRICKAGDQSRELFAILDGQVGVYKNMGENRRQLLSVIPKGGIFGEGGFFLNKPRAADVITLQKSTVLVIQHHPQFDQIIQSEKAESLQRRFWFLHGLLSSEVFSHVPTETLDSLVYAGNIKTVKEGTTLIREGEMGKSFFIIMQGSVSFSQKGKSLRALGQGGMFGEVALLVSGGVRTASATAQRDCMVIEIEMNEFYEILSNHLFLAKELEEIAWKHWHNH